MASAQILDSPHSYYTVIYCVFLLQGGEWFARDMEYGFDTLMENL